MLGLEMWWQIEFGAEWSMRLDFIYYWGFNEL